jgi:hypothetical protein
VNRTQLAGLLVLLLLALPARADDIDGEAVKKAIDQGREFLKKLQRADGGFDLPPAADTLETNFAQGYSALATLTLLKTGTPADDPSIERAFQWIYAQPLRKTYEVSLVILAIEARFAPPPETLEENKEKGYTSVVRNHFQKRARPVDRQKLEECVNWLLAHRSKKDGAGWRYPQGEIDQDNSCTQYAMLALKGARRLGANVPIAVFEEVADFFVQQQDATGPEVPWFAVPAADMAIHELATLDQRKKLEEKAKKEEEKREREREKAGTRERDKPAPGSELREGRAMNARGWSYLPRPLTAPDKTTTRTGEPPKRTVSEQISTATMTCSGIAALCIAKSELENAPASWRPREEAVETAIRDGCAFLVKWWNPKENFSSDPAKAVGWKYYYFYSVERAGVLCGTYKLGEHDWWDEITAHLLTQQQPEGSWPDAKGLSKLSPTCFALLFLSRSTIPLVPLPKKRVMTGGGGK